MKANSIRGWRLMCFLSRTILFSEKKKSNALLMVRFQEEVKGVPWVKWTFAGTSSKSSSSIFKACSKCLGRKSGSDAQWHFLGCVLRTSLTLLCSLLLKDKAHHPPHPSDSAVPILVTYHIPCSIWVRVWAPEIDSSGHPLLFSVCFYFISIPHVRGI